MTDREQIEREADKREAAAREATERARRRARIFGDVLPDQTNDDCDGSASDWSDRDGSDRDEEIRRDVPPHHG
jgi:hypothetical protein